MDGSAPREPICKFEDLKDMYTDLMNKYHPEQEQKGHILKDWGVRIILNIHIIMLDKIGIVLICQHQYFSNMIKHMKM